MSGQVQDIAQGWNVPRTLLGRLAWRASIAGKMAVAIVLALTPVTTIAVLGWLMRIMRRETVLALSMYGHGQSRKEALAQVGSTGQLAELARFPGWWRGLWSTLKTGVWATIAVGLAVLPYGFLLMVSWWAGWENSFNKGYEQAWVGPTLGLLGITVALATLLHLPMALAHFAFEGRLASIADIGRVRRLIAQVRWRYVWFSFVSVVLSVPLFASRALPTFIEAYYPGFATAAETEVAAVAFRWQFFPTIYLIIVLVFLRRWVARLYARALLALGTAGFGEAGRVAGLLEIKEHPGAQRTPRAIGGVVATILIAAFWMAFIAMLYISQFANHAWWNWGSQPIVALPWVFRPF